MLSMFVRVTASYKTSLTYVTGHILLQAKIFQHRSILNFLCLLWVADKGIENQPSVSLKSKLT